MYQILITTSSGPHAVHTLTVSFATEAQAVAAAELVNAGTTGGQNGGVIRQASLLFVPSPRQEATGGGERGFNIPGVDREAVNRVMDRFGHAVRSVEESRALEQVRAGFDRFISSAEQLMRRQTAGSETTGDSSTSTSATEPTGAADAATVGTMSSQMASPRPIRFMRASEVTETQELAASRSPLAAYGPMVLVWANEADLRGHEEVFSQA